jgi:hypothetical protein
LIHSRSSSPMASEGDQEMNAERRTPVPPTTEKDEGRENGSAIDGRDEGLMAGSTESAHT